MDLPTLISRRCVIPILGALGGIFFVFVQILIKNSVYTDSGEPDQTPRFAASDLGLYCLSISYKKDIMLIWVKEYENVKDTDQV